jgi:multiple sugar transport system permease protein
VLLLLGVVVVAPELWALFISFYQYRLGGSPQFTGWSNYTWLLSDDRLLAAFGRNVAYVLVTVTIEFCIAVPAALLMARPFRLQGLWLALIIAPYAVSNVVGVTTWRHLLAADTGLINNVLVWLGAPRLNWLSDPLLAQLSVVLVSIWRDVPFVFMIAYAAILSIPLELREAAQVDGASAQQSARYVILPIIAPALLTAAVFRIVFAFRQFDIVWLLTQGGPGQATELLSIFLYRTAFRYWNIGEAAALAWLMTIATLLLSLYIIRHMYAALWKVGGEK